VNFEGRAEEIAKIRILAREAVETYAELDYEFTDDDAYVKELLAYLQAKGALEDLAGLDLQLLRRFILEESEV